MIVQVWPTALRLADRFGSRSYIPTMQKLSFAPAVAHVIHAVEALLAPRSPDYERASDELAAIDEKELDRLRRVAAARVRSIPKPRGTQERTVLTKRQQREVLEEDRYTCRYCSTPVLSVEVLKELQRIGLWVYFAQGPPKCWHRIGWTYAATVDHVQPRVHHRSNLVAACWLCQDAKSSRPMAALERYGWSLRARSTHQWYGLQDRQALLHDVPTWQR